MNNLNPNNGLDYNGNLQNPCEDFFFDPQNNPDPDEEFQKESQKEKQAINKVTELVGISLLGWDSRSKVFPIDIGADSWELKKRKYKATACLRKLTELIEENNGKIPEITLEVEAKLQEAIETAHYHMGFSE